MKTCTSCKKQARQYTRIICPECGADMIRCKDCKSKGLEYRCSCGFTGP